jgi:hypothetical protein
MRPNFYVDHYIQTDILSVLLRQGPKNFSALKPAELENSLFMYHMRKLIARGIVEKKDGNFSLTAAGVRWLNKTGLGRGEVEAPRCLVQFLVLADNRLLLSERQEHMAEHLNRYLLPGGLHSFGETSLESAQKLSAGINLRLSGGVISQLETIAAGQNSHTIADIYLASVADDNHLFSNDIYKFSFMPISTALKLPAKAAGPIPFILTKYLAKSLGPREEFKF